MTDIDIDIDIERAAAATLMTDTEPTTIKTSTNHGTSTGTSTSITSKRYSSLQPMSLSLVEQLTPYANTSSPSSVASSTASASASHVEPHLHLSQSPFDPIHHNIIIAKSLARVHPQLRVTGQA